MRSEFALGHAGSAIANSRSTRFRKVPRGGILFSRVSAIFRGPFSPSCIFYIRFFLLILKVVASLALRWLQAGFRLASDWLQTGFRLARFRKIRAVESTVGACWLVSFSYLPNVTFEQRSITDISLFLFMPRSVVINFLKVSSFSRKYERTDTLNRVILRVL